MSGTKMPLENYKLFPLVEKSEFCDECIVLLNEEWPRSLTQRQRSMENCLNARPPMSFVLLDTVLEKAVGHARVCNLPDDKDSCWVESVVVSRSLRGIGLGKLLMKILEEKILQLGYTKVYLSTRDKEQFYMKCGYSLSHPVVHIGAHSNVLGKFPQIQRHREEPHVKAANPSDKLPKMLFHVVPPLPPPPPPPLKKDVGQERGQQSILPDKLIYMCKYLS